MAFFILFLAVILAVSVRGLPGNPTPAQLNSLQWKDNGPFELSPERGRYALLYAIVEDHSFHLPPEIARFTAPDVGYAKNHYVSIFAPMVSIMAIPGYLIGKYFDAAQFGTFAWMALFALLNVLLIRLIGIRLGANPLAATIAGLTFLFATPAFAYAVTLYEHHLSTFLILLSLYLLIRYNNLISLFAIWIIYAFSFTVDYPNLFLMFPIAFATFFRSGVVDKINEKISLKVSLPRLLTVLGVIVPLAALLWINQMSYNNPLQLSGTVPRVLGVKPNDAPILYGDVVKAKSQTNNLTELQKLDMPQPGVFAFFQPRNMLNGMYILLISPDRGVLLFTPVILFGIAGIVFAIRKRQKYASILCGIIGFNLILYAMWGDPYGGWAFGGRYLIPAYAILAIYIALLLTYFGQKRFFILFFFVVFSYSVAVNTLGAVTSNSNPPQIEADSLSNQIHKRVDFTYIRNANDLNIDLAKSYVYESYANKYLTAWEYYSYLTFFIIIVSALYIIPFHANVKKKYLKGEQHAL